MNKHGIKAMLVAGVAATGSTLGCQNLPGTDEQQGAVAGGAAGAILGSAIAENEVFGALLGGALGAAGGYLIGANKEKLLNEDDRAEAREAVAEASRNPATPKDVATSSTADLNSDGFVTMDEVVAMEEAGLTDQQMINRLEATGQVFALNSEQEDRLIEAGVSEGVVTAMESINQEERERLLEKQNEIISRSPRR